MTTLYYGSFVHSVSLDELDFCLDALVCVSEDGYISWVERNVDPSQLQDAATRHSVILDDVDFVELGRNDFLCPGLIDTHTVSHCVYRHHHHHQEIHGLTSVEPHHDQHAPQYPNLGLGQEYQLLDWLSEVTFPREKMFADQDYAAKVYEQVVLRTLSAGVSSSALCPDNYCFHGF